MKFDVMKCVYEERVGLTLCAGERERGLMELSD